MSGNEATSPETKRAESTFGQWDDRPMRRPLLQPPAERLLGALLRPRGLDAAESARRFLEPAGEPALAPAGGVSWRLCANPVSVFIGGVAAVVMELAEPRVRSGVWEHTRFREQPLDRLQGTGHAAMMTVYGPASRTRALIAEVNRRHTHVAGTTPGGGPYRADDPALLAWVQATASYGFLQAYRMCVAPVASVDADLYFAEGCEAARLYGVVAPPATEAEVDALFARMLPRLEASAIVGEFLGIVRTMPALPGPLRLAQAALARAAVQCVPADVRERIGLAGAEWRLPAWQWVLLRRASRAAARWPLATHPAVLACRRLGLADDLLYR
jgi:uncharacterized protein (DUF2236 family)